jgi:hypothetical protein
MDAGFIKNKLNKYNELMLIANIKNKPIALNPLLIIPIFLLIYAKLDTVNRSLLDDRYHLIYFWLSRFAGSLMLKQYSKYTHIDTNLFDKL